MIGGRNAFGGVYCRMSLCHKLREDQFDNDEDEDAEKE